MQWLHLVGDTFPISTMDHSIGSSFEEQYLGMKLHERICDILA